MGPFLIVDAQPLARQRLQLGDRLEEMGVEDLCAVGAVEALDIRVLVWLSRLDVVSRYRARRTSRRRAAP
jgi:hypothetical protein